MKIIPTELEGVVCIEPQVFGDDRGFFMESWRDSWRQSLGIKESFVQDNHSLSSKGILRGLHYQINQPQGKLVRVVRGEVFDVAVDMRESSPNFGRWVGRYLNSRDKTMMWVPPGFAHGFLVLSDEAEFLYKCTEYYAPEFDRTLLWNDKDLNIDWPLSDVGEPLLSEKDRLGTPFLDAEKYGVSL